MDDERNMDCSLSVLVEIDSSRIFESSLVRHSEDYLLVPQPPKEGESRKWFFYKDSLITQPQINKRNYTLIDIYQSSHLNAESIRLFTHNGKE